MTRETSAIAIRSAGLVTSVGLTAPSTCAAIRAGLTNPTQSSFIDPTGNLIMAHQVALERPWRGGAKLARMAAMAIEECLENVPRDGWDEVPLLLCLAERTRPGRLDQLDTRLIPELQRILGARFSADSSIVAHGRVGVGVALVEARRLIHEQRYQHVLIVATDTLLTWPTLSFFGQHDRLLTERNSNGFIPGEGAGALLVSRPENDAALMCTGIGFGAESAGIYSMEPLRGTGLAEAIRRALGATGCELHDLDLRIADLSGEQFYFKESALAVARLLRQRKQEFDIWHPAECTGEVGTVAGIAMIAVVDAACRLGYSPGDGVLAHLANDSGERAAMVLQFGKLQ